jgi:hypothetical protein
MSDDIKQFAGKAYDRSTWLRCRFEHQFIDIAPTPVFAGLQTCHDGVSRLMEVLSSMFAGRVIAAANMAAGEANAQMNPRSTGPEAFLASFRGSGANVVDLIEMFALGHHLSSGELAAITSGSFTVRL